MQKQVPLKSETDPVKLKCFDIPNIFILDNEGCPQELILKTRFSPKDSTITQEIKNELSPLGDFLKKNKNYQVIIYSHTDSIGTRKENKILTKRRAKAVKRVLISFGVSSTKLTSLGRGEDTPTADNTYAKGRDQNNRVEIQLIK